MATFDINSIDMNGITSKLRASTSAPKLSNISSNVTDPASINNIMDDINKAISSADSDETFTAVCCLLQKGGTSKQMNQSSSFEYGTVKVTKKVLNDACTKFKTTPRQLARALAPQIIDLAIAISLPGNQSKNFRLDYTDASQDELAWASDFQTFNENCPERVRNWLIKNYQTRFRTKP